VILKSLSRKTNSGSQLVKYVFRYILNPEKHIDTIAPQILHDSHSPLIIRHNIRSRTSIKGFIQEFEENESYRLVKRKDSVRLFHHIIGFSNLDRENVTDKVLKDIAKQFIKLRGNNLYLGTAHYNTDSIHLHLICSGTQLNGRSSRMSKQQMHHLKLSLDAYQKEKYPELIHSLPEHGKKRRLAKEALITAIKHERSTNKLSLSTVLEQAYEQATSKKHFLSQIKALGHEPYVRNGKLQGVLYEGKKYRFSRLGFDENRFEQLEQAKAPVDRELVQLQELRKGRLRELQKEERSIKKVKELPKNLAEPELRQLDILSAIRQKQREGLEPTLEPAEPESNSLPDTDIQESVGSEDEAVSCTPIIAKLQKPAASK